MDQNLRGSNYQSGYNARVNQANSLLKQKWNLRRVVLSLVVWLGASLIFTFLYAGTHWGAYGRVWKTSALWTLNLVVLGFAIFGITRLLPYEKVPRILFFSLHALAAVGVAAANTGLAFLELHLNPDPSIAYYLNNFYQQHFNVGLFIYGALASWFYFLEYLRRNKQHAVREAELQRITREAELKALKAQINPHFLFNSLNSINALVMKSPEQAREMVVRLGNILRYALEGTLTDFVPLAKELDFIRDYLAIEKIRFGPKLQFKIEVEESLSHILIPPMTLQPLVENCIKHGLSPLPEGGLISLEIREMDDRLQFRLTDTGKGVNHAPLEELFDKGIGLRNTIERLQFVFEKQFHYQIGQHSPTGFLLTFSIPLTRKTI